MKRYTLEDINKMRLSSFSLLIKEAERKGEPLVVRFQAFGIDYKASYYPTELSLLFEWEYNNENRASIIHVEKRSSNLRKGSVYYFVCPFSGELCRVLYTDYYKIMGRKAFPHIYKSQKLSRVGRIYERFFRYYDEPIERYRKPYYRGKLTPYGRRLLKFEERQEAALSRFGKYIITQ